VRSFIHISFIASRLIGNIENLRSHTDCIFGQASTQNRSNTFPKIDIKLSGRFQFLIRMFLATINAAWPTKRFHTSCITHSGASRLRFVKRCGSGAAGIKRRLFFLVHNRPRRAMALNIPEMHCRKTNFFQKCFEVIQTP